MMQDYQEITKRYGPSMGALVREMARDIGGTIKVEQGWPPSWDPENRVVKLPFYVNADLLPEEALHDGRSFMGHESGEAEYNELKPDDPRWKDKAILKSFVNILGDVRINLKREDDYPGFKRSHTYTNERFVTKFKERAEAPRYVADDTQDTGKASLVAMCLVELVLEGATTYRDVMSWDLNPKVRTMMQTLKPECDLALRDVDCEDIADNAMGVYKRLKIADIMTEEEEQQAVYDKSGEDVGQGDWGAGKDYGEQLAESTGTDLCSGNHTQKGMVNTYTFDPSHDNWNTFGNDREVSIGEIAGVDVDRLAAVLGTRLIKILQAPATIPQRHQTAGRMDASRIAQVLHYRQDVFKRKVIEDRVNAAVSLSVDCSSSMRDINAEIRAGLGAWSKALQICNVPHEIIGWSQSGYQHSTLPQGAQQYLYRSYAIDWQMVKEFNEDWRKGIYRIKYQMCFKGGTPSGEGVSLPGFRLVGRPEPRKFLLVFTDGSPAIYANGPSEVHYNYIKDSIAGFRRRGIRVIGVALNEYCFASVRSMFGDNDTICINGANDLMTRQGGDLLRDIMGRKK